MFKGKLMVNLETALDSSILACRNVVDVEELCQRESLDDLFTIYPLEGRKICK